MKRVLLAVVLIAAAFCCFADHDDQATWMHRHHETHQAVRAAAPQRHIDSSIALCAVPAALFAREQSYVADRDVSFGRPTSERLQLLDVLRI